MKTRRSPLRQRRFAGTAMRPAAPHERTGDPTAQDTAEAGHYIYHRYCPAAVCRSDLEDVVEKQRKPPQIQHPNRVSQKLTDCEPPGLAPCQRPFPPYARFVLLLVHAAPDVVEFRAVDPGVFLRRMVGSQPKDQPDESQSASSQKTSPPAVGCIDGSDQRGAGHCTHVRSSIEDSSGQRPVFSGKPF